MLAYKRNKRINTLFEIVFIQAFVVDKNNIGVFPDYFGNYLTKKVAIIYINKYEYFLRELQLFKTSANYKVLLQKTNSVTKIIDFLQRSAFRILKILRDIDRETKFLIANFKCFTPTYKQLDRIFDNLLMEINNLGPDCETPIRFIDQELYELSNRPI